MKRPSLRFQRGFAGVSFLALVVALILAAGLSRAADDVPRNNVPSTLPSVGQIGITKQRPPFIVGADVSSVQAAEARGVKFTDNGVEQDLFTILKNHGFNYIRLRIFNDPTAAGPANSQNARPYSAEGFCDLAHTIAMGKRAKAAGMSLLIDFHYSDSWADPGKQYTPRTWRDLSFPDLVTAMHDWTRDCVQQLKDAGAEPDMVQVGNEITPGMMNDHLPEHGGTARNWDQLSQLLKAGISGVEEVDPKILIMLHIDKGGDNRISRTWIDNAISHGVEFDVLGESCYTQWQGQPSGWKANFEDLTMRYPHLYFVCAEVADEVRSSNDTMHDLPEQKGLGTFIWEPTQNGNRQGLFTSPPRFGRGGRRGAATATAPAVALPTTPPTAPIAAAPTTRPGAVIPARMGIYDQIVKDYGLRRD